LHLSSCLLITYSLPFNPACTDSFLLIVI